MKPIRMAPKYLISGEGQLKSNRLGPHDYTMPETFIFKKWNISEPVS
jgi:hypothetical protein